MNEEELQNTKRNIEVELKKWMEELLSYRSGESTTLLQTRRQRDRVIASMEAAEALALLTRAVRGPVAR